jgi:hypothetical protein
MTSSAVEFLYASQWTLWFYGCLITITTEKTELPGEINFNIRSSVFDFSVLLSGLCG